MRLLFVLLLISGNAFAGQFWSEDKTTNNLIISANALLILDWAQTRYGAARPDEFEETGFARHFIGAHPKINEVNRYNASVLVLMNVAGYYLPEDATFFGVHWNPKKNMYFGMTVTEGVTVYRNYQAGVKLDF